MARILSKLKLTWLVLFILATILTIVAAILQRTEVRPFQQFLLYAGGALIGFACSAFFSRDHQFLLRGVKDPVYLVENDCFPRVYKLTNETVNAMGGRWDGISHVSERMIGHLFGGMFGKGERNLKTADLYRIKGEKTVYAVLSGTRYGVPDEETLCCIWGKSWPVVEVDAASELDRLIPGRDLISEQYWPKRFRSSPPYSPSP